MPAYLYIYTVLLLVNTKYNYNKKNPTTKLACPSSKVRQNIKNMKRM